MLVHVQADVLADHQEQGRGGVQVGPVPSDAAQLHAVGVLRHPLRHIRLGNVRLPAHHHGTYPSIPLLIHVHRCLFRSILVDVSYIVGE